MLSSNSSKSDVSSGENKLSSNDNSLPEKIHTVVNNINKYANECLELCNLLANQNTTLMSENKKYIADYEQLSEEMDRFRKVSVISNLSKQISAKDNEINMLKKRLQKIQVPPASILENDSHDTHTRSIKLPNLTPPKESINNSIDCSNKHDSSSNSNDSANADDNDSVNADDDNDSVSADDDNDSVNADDNDSVNANDNDSVSADDDNDSVNANDNDSVNADDNDSANADDDNDSANADDDNDTSENDSGDEVEFELKIIKKQKYYISNDNPPEVFTVTADDDIGEQIGVLVNESIQLISEP